MIRSFLDVSSGHLSPETWVWLDAQLADDTLRYPRNAHAAQIAGGRTRYGWCLSMHRRMLRWDSQPTCWRC